ncbi:MAG: hypothetical protein ACI4PO_10235, partial [Faecousia sp.]
MSSQCVLKIPQYIQYSGISKTFVRTKSLAQNRKKQFLEVANNLSVKPDKGVKIPRRRASGDLSRLKSLHILGGIDLHAGAHGGNH